MGIKEAHMKIGIIRDMVANKPKEWYEKGIDGFIEQITDKVIVNTIKEVMKIIEEECPEVKEEIER